MFAKLRTKFIYFFLFFLLFLNALVAKKNNDIMNTLKDSIDSLTNKQLEIQKNLPPVGDNAETIIKSDLSSPDVSNLDIIVTSNSDIILYCCFFFFFLLLIFLILYFVKPEYLKKVKR